MVVKRNRDNPRLMLSTVARAVAVPRVPAIITAYYHTIQLSQSVSHHSLFILKTLSPSDKSSKCSV